MNMTASSIFVESTEYRQLHDFAGDWEFARRSYVGSTTTQLLKYIQETLAEEGVDTISVQSQDHLHVNVQRREVVTYADRMRYRWTLVTLGPENEATWHGSLIDKPWVKWNSTAVIMMQEFAKSGHPVFRCSSPLSRGVLNQEEVRWTIFDRLHRRRKFREDVTQNYPVSHPAQYLQSSHDTVHW